LSKIVEQVAMAISTRSHSDECCLEDIARAAIAAMRLMPVHQFIALPVTEIDQDTSDSSFTAGEVKAVWLAMLDEALA
jgi:hypothetical protein